MSIQKVTSGGSGGNAWNTILNKDNGVRSAKRVWGFADLDWELQRSLGVYRYVAGNFKNLIPGNFFLGQGL